MLGSFLTSENGSNNEPLRRSRRLRDKTLSHGFPPALQYAALPGLSTKQNLGGSSSTSSSSASAGAPCAAGSGADHSGGGALVCNACLLPVEEGDDVTLLEGCRHYGHRECVHNWAQIDNRCPLCRTRFRKCALYCYKLGHNLMVLEQVANIQDVDQDFGADAQREREEYEGLDLCVHCRRSGGADDDEPMAVCRICRDAYHLSCLPPNVRNSVQEAGAVGGGASSSSSSGPVGASNLVSGTGLDSPEEERPTRRLEFVCIGCTEKPKLPAGWADEVGSQSASENYLDEAENVEEEVLRLENDVDEGVKRRRSMSQEEEELEDEELEEDDRALQLGSNNSVRVKLEPEDDDDIGPAPPASTLKNAAAPASSSSSTQNIKPRKKRKVDPLLPFIPEDSDGFNMPIFDPFADDTPMATTNPKTSAPAFGTATSSSAPFPVLEAPNADAAASSTRPEDKDEDDMMAFTLAPDLSLGTPRGGVSKVKSEPLQEDNKEEDEAIDLMALGGSRRSLNPFANRNKFGAASASSASSSSFLSKKPAAQEQAVASQLQQAGHQTSPPSSASRMMNTNINASTTSTTLTREMPRFVKGPNYRLVLDLEAQAVSDSMAREFAKRIDAARVSDGIRQRFHSVMLPQNRLSATGAADFLRVTQPTQVLDLQYNRLTDSALLALGFQLLEYPCPEVRLSFNKTLSAGAIAGFLRTLASAVMNEEHQHDYSDTRTGGRKGKQAFSSTSSSAYLAPRLLAKTASSKWWVPLEDCAIRDVPSFLQRLDETIRGDFEACCGGNRREPSSWICLALDTEACKSRKENCGAILHLPGIAASSLREEAAMQAQRKQMATRSKGQNSSDPFNGMKNGKAKGVPGKGFTSMTKGEIALAAGLDLPLSSGTSKGRGGGKGKKMKGKHSREMEIKQEPQNDGGPQIDETDGSIKMPLPLSLQAAKKASTTTPGAWPSHNSSAASHMQSAGVPGSSLLNPERDFNNAQARPPRQLTPSEIMERKIEAAKQKRKRERASAQMNRLVAGIPAGVDMLERQRAVRTLRALLQHAVENDVPLSERRINDLVNAKTRANERAAVAGQFRRGEAAVARSIPVSLSGGPSSGSSFLGGAHDPSSTSTTSTIFTTGAANRIMSTKTRRGGTGEVTSVQGSALGVGSGVGGGGQSSDPLLQGFDMDESSLALSNKPKKKTPLGGTPPADQGRSGLLQQQGIVALFGRGVKQQKKVEAAETSYRNVVKGCGSGVDTIEYQPRPNGNGDGPAAGSRNNSRVPFNTREMKTVRAYLTERLRTLSGIFPVHRVVGASSSSTTRTRVKQEVKEEEDGTAASRGVVVGASSSSSSSSSARPFIKQEYQHKSSNSISSRGKQNLNVKQEPGTENDHNGIGGQASSSSSTSYHTAAATSTSASFKPKKTVDVTYKNTTDAYELDIDQLAPAEQLELASAFLPRRMLLLNKDPAAGQFFPTDLDESERKDDDSSNKRILARMAQGLGLQGLCPEDLDHGPRGCDSEEDKLWDHLNAPRLGVQHQGGSLALLNGVGAPTGYVDHATAKAQAHAQANGLAGSSAGINRTASTTSSVMNTPNHRARQHDPTYNSGARVPQSATSNRDTTPIRRPGDGHPESVTPQGAQISATTPDGRQRNAGHSGYGMGLASRNALRAGAGAPDSSMLDRAIVVPGSSEQLAITRSKIGGGVVLAGGSCAGAPMTRTTSNTSAAASNPAVRVLGSTVAPVSSQTAPARKNKFAIGGTGNSASSSSSAIPVAGPRGLVGAVTSQMNPSTMPMVRTVSVNSTPSAAGAAASTIIQRTSISTMSTSGAKQTSSSSAVGQQQQVSPVSRLVGQTFMREVVDKVIAHIQREFLQHELNMMRTSQFLAQTTAMNHQRTTFAGVSIDSWLASNPERNVPRLREFVARCEQMEEFRRETIEYKMAQIQSKQNIKARKR
ncbi:unnamed protein product [Amoebophrya sp. A25]|nr:unnamed protein product [Amoebophrya sp. A25]|eukprot:GSA25T00026077001.1